MSIESTAAAAAAARSEMASHTAYQRLAKLFDEGVFTEIDAFTRSASGYAGVVAGRGQVDGIGVFAFAQDRASNGGAMSSAQAAKIRKVYDLALKTGSPVVAMYDSLGGQLEEGCDLLGAYGEVLKYTNNLSGVVPQISVVLGPCFGTQALIAAAGDVVIMSRKASLSLHTDGTEADAEKNAACGVAHVVCETEEEAIRAAARLLSLLPANNLDAAGCAEFDLPEVTSGDAVAMIADLGSTVELSAAFGSGARTLLGTVEGETVGFVELSGKELGGKACAKAARMVRFCDAFNLPIVTLLNAESFGCLKGAAKLSCAYAEATAPKITLITGSAFGAVYIAAAGTGAAADMTYAWEEAFVSPLSPEAAAYIALTEEYGGKLKGQKDPAAARAAVVEDYKQTHLTALRAAEKGYVDEIIPAENSRTAVAGALELISDKRVSTLPKKHTNFML